MATEQETNDARWRQYDHLSRWPLRYLEKTGQFFIEASEDGLPMKDGRWWLPTIEVTDIVEQLRLNQGEVRREPGHIDSDEHGWWIWGPGEAYAYVGSEGRFAMVLLKDGRQTQRLVTHIAVDVAVAAEARARTPRPARGGW